MNNNNKFLWAIVCLLILIAFGGYLYTSDPFGWRGSEMQQNADTDGKGTETADTSENAKADSASESAAKSEKTAETDSSGEQSSAEVSSTTPIPTFDLVRVEPDGSTLIAGRATPGTDVEVVSNGQVIATTKAGATGDFAAVLDKPLPAGDHQIVLRTNGDGNSTTQSEEVATISVPKDDPNELLVMVTKPGEASRILTKPDVAMVEEPQASEASASETVANNEKKEQEKQVSEEAFSESGETKVAAADSTEADKAAQGGASTQVTTESASTASAEQSTEEQSASTGGDNSNGADTGANGTTKTAAASETANVQSTSDSNSTVAVPSEMRIDAVEIEDGRIFVAGSATPGGQVRVFVDGEFIGSSGVSASGRFLVEAERDLAVGDHTIGAELIMRSGESPVMRVAVPFARPEGQMVAAVAAPETSEGSQVQDTGENTTVGTQVAAASQNDSSGSDTSVSKINEENTLPTRNDSNEQASADATETPTVVQPALQQQDNSVIIRRGDTLWQISRRIYGQGVRYTTIYLANDHLMDHPDWIEPGQIFAVPETHVENAEELHREHVRTRRN